MMANSTSCSASLATLALTSSTAVTPRRVGQLATMAGRSRPTAMRRISLEMAIRAPVLPAETTAWASPSRTASMAFQRLEPLPRRSAVAGFSSLAMTSSVWRTSQAARAAGRRASSASRRARSPCSRKRTSWPASRSSAIATPSTTTGGPWSPPMASIEMVTGWGTGGVALPLALSRVRRFRLHGESARTLSRAAAAAQADPASADLSPGRA